MQKYIFISGGVISGLGKGITTASLSAILKNNGYSVSPMKVDMYLNQDAGTIRPIEHGEVFVTEDGLETDQDIGNYERFLGDALHRRNYCTTGQVYAEVLRKERAFEYEGEDVEAIPHVTDEIIRRFEAAGEGKDFVLIELGGTVGEYQNAIFFEAARILQMRQPKDVIHVHVAYLPIPGHLGEMKTKPVQQSVRMLNSMGIQPDFIIGRSSEPLDDRRKERIALFCNIPKKAVISGPDVETIYEIPLILAEQNLGAQILTKLGMDPRKEELSQWKKLVETVRAVEEEVRIAVVGKYFGTGDYMLSDVYISVIESIRHAAWAENKKPVLEWIDSEDIEKQGPDSILAGYDGIVVPGGFGSRGIKGTIDAIRFARERKVPYLGLCYGMQLAAVEFARNVAGIEGANTEEIDPDAQDLVVHVMPEQQKMLLKQEYGGTMRLGSFECRLKEGTISRAAYDSELINERHRHRYEFNNAYRDKLAEAGLVIAGVNPETDLVEIIELQDHPFFVGVQFHPEFKSQPLAPHPLFSQFIRATKEAR